jgi:hypothetical protein
MNKRPSIAITALVLGVALSSAAAFAQNGPSALNFSASSNPQTGGQPYSVQPAAKGRTTSAPTTQPSQASGANGPSALNFSASSNPQTGGQPYSAQTAAKGQSVYDLAPHQPGSETLGPAGPAGANFGATSNPQTGR